MTAPFTTTLRSRAGTIDLRRPGQPSITIRVEMPEVWDVVRVAVSSAEPVITVKTGALAALVPGEAHAADFVVKFRGWEILDEGESLAEAGVQDGSILLVSYRRRRPTR